MHYKTIQSQTEGLYKEKGSKFICYLFNVHSEASFIHKLSTIKEKHQDARHWCYAYRIGVTGEIYRINDDGEPSGTAGKPIYNQLLSAEITNIGAVVVRYFGGTKLGTSGLIKAYKEATISAIQASLIQTKEVCDFYEITFTYQDMPIVMKWINQNKIEIIQQDFNLDCYLEISIPMRTSETIISQLPHVAKFKIKNF